MKILTSVSAAVLLMLILQACGPLVELEEENVALQSRVDSLEVALVTTGTKLADIRERIAELESENLRMSDQNRDLSARLAEARNQSAAGRSGTANAAPPPQFSSTPPPAASQQSPPPGIPPAASQPAPAAGFARHDPRIQPDMAWLTRYQDALYSYNTGSFQEATVKFDALARGSSPNNHIDNCVFWLGQCALMQGRADEAVGLFTTVLTYNGSNKISDALYSRAEAYGRKGDSMNARRDYQKLLDSFPGSARAADARERLRALR